MQQPLKLVNNPPFRKTQLQSLAATEAQALWQLNKTTFVMRSTWTGCFILTLLPQFHKAQQVCSKWLHSQDVTHFLLLAQPASSTNNIISELNSNVKDFVHQQLLLPSNTTGLLSPQQLRWISHFAILVHQGASKLLKPPGGGMLTWCSSS